MTDQFVFFEKITKKDRPQVGDLFCYKLVDGPFGFGRVIKNGCVIGGFEATLIYLYNAFSDAEDQVPDLSKEELILPPYGIDSTPWAKGYFKRIEQAPLADADIFPAHCFKCMESERYYDEYGHERDARFEPCGADITAGWEWLAYRMLEVGIGPQANG